MPSKTSLRRLALSFLLVLASASVQTPLLANQVPEHNQQSASPQVVIVLDINPNQRKVFPLESELATGVLERLHQQDDAISLVTFGSGDPVLRSGNVKPREAIDSIKNLNPEQPQSRYFPVHLYEALNLALNQFADDTRPKFLLIIAEGRDDFGGKAFKQIVSRARQLGIHCYVALVAGHSLRGSKSILRYGFYLSDLASKTHGRCLEIGDRRKNIPRFVTQFSAAVLDQSQNQNVAHP